MPVRTLVVGPLMANCHLFYDKAGVAIIDPGGDPESIAGVIEEIGLPVRAIVNTHGHADHVAANDVLRDRYDVPVLIHEADGWMLQDPNGNLSAMFGMPVSLRPGDRLLRDGDIIDLEAGLKPVDKAGSLTVIHTPGHTAGGICLSYPGGLFTGDTLFAGSVGRTDFPGGDWDALSRSIKDRLLRLGDETIIYPGHGPNSSLGEERRCNPFLGGQR